MASRLNLTPKEYRLLQVLAQDPGKVITHQSLLKSVWGQSHVNSPQYLRIFMRKLRQKIELDPNRPKILLTELGLAIGSTIPGGRAWARRNEPRGGKKGALIGIIAHSKNVSFPQHDAGNVDLHRGPRAIPRLSLRVI